MASYEVKKPFRDKDTMDLFGVGSEYYNEDPERVKYLKAWGYLGEEIEVEPDDNPNESDSEEEGIEHVGGGYYELPNGEKVKGKEKALEALKELKGSDK